MIKKLFRLFCLTAALGLLYAPHAWTAQAVGYTIPPPLAQQLSSDGKSLYYAAAVGSGPQPAEVKPDAAPAALFSPLKAQMKADAAFVRDRQVVRSRQVDIDLNLLTGSADLPPDVIATGRVISLNLFDNVTFIAEADRVERTSSGVTWVGRLRGIDLSQVVIIVNGDVVVGNISMPAGRYHIRFVGNGVHEVQEIDQSLFPPDEPYVPIPLQTHDDRSSLQKQDTQADDGSTIDVMVVYSATTRAAAGGTAAMQALINLAVSETNQSYQNSGIVQRLRLVHSEEVTYTETGSLDDALDCITNTADGCIDNIHALRNTYGADLVSFWVENGGAYCGLGWLMDTVSSSFASHGFSTVARSCATGYYSFGHELGHNMGARHDVYVDSAATPYAFAHGYIYTAAASPWRTVMAYNDGCSAVGKNCTRIQYWSNPSNSYGGVAIGNSTTADNHRTLNNTAPTVANFRSGLSSVNGVCGSSNGQTFATAPTTNLCSAGTATAVSGSGPWTWSCTGSNGGSTANCSANKTTGTPSIRVISPNGGETWTTGSTHNITWTSSNLNLAGSIYIYYWYNSNWQQIAGPLSTSVTVYSWTVPNTPTTSAYIAIGNWVNNAWEIQDQSDQSFTIQAASSCTYTITPTSFSFSASGNTGTVSVTTSSSSCYWSATSNNTSWITITAGSSGTGNGTVGYSVSANATGSARTGTMTIGGQTFTVIQNGATSCAYTLTPTSSSFSASGNTGTVSVTTSSGSCSWSAVSNDWWITITAGSAGTGNGTVGYSISANTTGSARTGTMTIGGQTFTITQNGATSCTYTLTPTSSSVSASGNTGTVSVTTSSGSCFWNATSNVSWITITGWGSGSGTGNGTVGYSVSANATGSARTGTMTIGGQTFTVTQNGATSCTYTLTPTSSLFSFSGNTGTVSVTTSLSSCPWNATSNVSWITITAGSSGTGNGTVGYSISANIAGSTRTGTMTIGEQTFTVTQYGVYIPPGANATLYFPHVDTTFSWQTEIAVINTGDQTLTGTLTGLGDVGQPVDTMTVTLPARGRREINVAEGFTNNANIKHIIFDANSAAIQGYTKFYIPGAYRAAIPAVKEVNTSDIYIPHIDSGAQWWTGVSLVNATSATKDLTITFDTGQSRQITLNAYQHWADTIAKLVSNQAPTDIQSAVITNASGVIGLELFGNNGDSKRLEGILLTDDTSSTLYYPHVVGNGWWTGIVAYNSAWYDGYITITPYDAQGNPLSTTFQSLAAKHKYVGTVAQLGLPAETAWFKIDSTGLPLTGFELLGTNDDNQLAAYAGGGGSGTKAGVLPKIEKNGWTDIVLVNTEDNAATVTLTAYNDNGTPVATKVLPVGGHAKVANRAETFFSQDISGATYIAYSSNRNVVGFQLNGSSDGTMLDGLPGLAGTN